MIPAMSVSQNSTVRVRRNSEGMPAACGPPEPWQRRWHRGVPGSRLRRNAHLFHGILAGGGLNRKPSPLASRRMNPLLRLFAVAALFTASLSHAASFEGKVTLAMTAGKNHAQVLDYSIKGTSIRI